LLFDIFRTLGTTQFDAAFTTGKSLPFTTTHAGLAAVATGLLTYFIHGFLDYFMLFNATALLFWLLVGLWLFARNDVLKR
jgi:hypothetical protein